MDINTVEPLIKTKPPGPRAKKIIRHVKKYAAPSTHEEFVWDASRPAIGPFCTDPDGNIILDLASHVASLALGYNYPKILEDIGVPVDPLKIAGQDFMVYYPPKKPFGNSSFKPAKDMKTPQDLQEILINITSQFKFNKVFLINSGAEAVENAIKICYDNRNMGKQYGICFSGAFHGRTLGALSLNRSKTVHRKRYPSIPNMVELPYCTHNKDCNCMNELERILYTIDPEEVSYVIIEPVQGEGGYRIPSKKFMKFLKNYIINNEILLISDEVQSGLGRTGKWWAIENFDIKPDVIASAKALRVGATISTDEIFPKETARISSTWGGGDILNSAVGYKTIEIIGKEKLMKNSKVIGKYFVKRLGEITDKYSIAENSRGLGLMLAIDYSNKTARDLVVTNYYQNHGVLTLGCGKRTQRFLPPLNVDKRIIDIAVDSLDKAVREVENW